MNLDIDSEVIIFAFDVYRHIEIRPKIEGTLVQYIGATFFAEEWVFEVSSEMNDRRANHDAIRWHVTVTAGYVGPKT